MEKFKDIEYVRPDLKAINKQLKKVIKGIKKANSYQEFKDKVTEAEGLLVENMDTSTLCSIRNDINKNDKFYEQERNYLNEKSTGISLTMISLYKALVKSPYRKEFDEEYGYFLTKKIEESLKLSNLFSILDEVKESKLAEQYSKDAALCQVDFKGEKCNFYGLLKHMESTDRQERKEAFEAWANLYESVSDKLDATYDKLVKLRVKKAKHLGFANFIDYIYPARERYDYKAKDIEQFRNNVREVIVPFCQELFDKQKERLGIDKLHFYDEALVFPEGNALPIGNKDELVNKALKMYTEMSKETGEYFNFMVDHELFDLETHPGKRLGGYCTFLPKSKAPFIFSNFNGTSADVDVLTHEAGHAFQAYLTSFENDIPDLSFPTMESCEIHSMSMEFFAHPWMELFFKEDTEKYYYSHIASTLSFLPYGVLVDHFQHEVYNNPNMSKEERKATFRKLEKMYIPETDYHDYPILEKGGYFYRQGHIFESPFYYIDYTLAQVCALQFFKRMLDKDENCWKDYIHLCKLGGTKPFLELVEEAKLVSPFKDNCLEGVVNRIYEELDKIDDTKL